MAPRSSFVVPPESTPCPHCGGINSEEEYRCRHCQRRLKPGGPPTSEVAVPEELHLGRPNKRPGAPADGPRQGTLFGGAQLPKVIPFESIAPERVSLPPEIRSGVAGRSAASARPKAPSGQQSLELLPPVPLQAASQPAFCCEAPIAPRRRRMTAAAIDAAYVLFGFGLFLLTFHLLGGRIVLVQRTAPLYGLVALALSLFYKAVWCAAGADSPGVRRAGLRLLNFDGQPPTLRQRTLRLFGACISVAAVGWGLLWALLDREKLAWHDHISSTFLTMRDPKPPRS